MSIDRRGASWRARLRTPEGRMIQRSFARKSDAQRWEREQRSALDRGDWINPQDGAVTFAAYADEWLRHQRAGRRVTTIAQIESRLRGHILPVLGPLPLARIRNSDCQEVLTRAAEHLAPLTVRVLRGTMTAVLAAAVADRLIASSPAVRLTVPASDRAGVDVLSNEQVITIADRIGDRWRAMVLVGARTGLRSAELRALTADRLTGVLGNVTGLAAARGDGASVRVDRQIDTKRGFGPVKTVHAERTVSIDADTARAISEHVETFGLGRDGLIFHDKRDGRPLSSSQASREWQEATTGLGLPEGTGWHLLRHTHATFLLAAGVNVAYVSRRLGHASPAITLRTYSHVLPSDEVKALAVIEGIASAAR